MDLSTSSGSRHCPPSKVVYFVSTSMDYGSFGDNPGMVSWSIFCVDLESKVDSVLQPRFRLCDASFDEAAFCIFESTLYVFEGYKTTKCEGRSIYSYKLKLENFNLELTKSMMKEVGSMNNVKYAPIAIRTPDGARIIVGSCLTSWDFEIFNPKNGKCRILSRINCGVGSLIFSYAFLTKYVLLVQTKTRDGHQSFTLDLKAPHLWEECPKFSITSLQYSSLIFAKNICLTPVAGYYLDDSIISKDEVADALRMGWYLYPKISSLPEDFISNYGAITLIADEDENGVCEFCIFSLALEEMDEWNYIPRITLDVYRCDLNVCRESMKKKNYLKMGPKYDGDNEWKRWERFNLPGATKMKSLKFCLEQNSDDHLNILSFSSFSGCA